MQANRPLYPYPLLSAFTDDYLNSVFSVDLQTKIYGKELMIFLKTKIVNFEIVNLIESKKVAIVYHFECPQTGFRKTESSFFNNLEVSLNRDDVHGSLKINSYLVSNQDLANYTNQKFHNELQGYSFDLERGTILGIANNFSIDIVKDDLDILNRESIFSIVRNNNKTENEIVTDFYNDKIIIKLKEEDYDYLTKISIISSLQDIINSLIVLPVLVDVLHNIYNTEDDQRDLVFGMFVWYRVIRRTLKQNFYIDIETDQFKPDKILSLSQRLIETPISDSILYLYRKYGKIEVEDINDED